MAENRKQLANIRVIQKNLVFAVGLPLELSQDNEKKEKVLHMFRQFGPTQKETITDRTAYAGSQGPSACVYITYQKPEDAVRAVTSLSNTKIEGRTIKVSLGTTKYCSNFLKNSQCPKAECLYLHELADEEASFTKEDIHLGKHLVYEHKLLEQTLSNSISHSKVLSPSNESNRTNHNRNADNCSESSDDLHQNNSFYEDSETSELSPTTNSQNIENMRNMGLELNIESENNHQILNSACSELKNNVDGSPKQVFRSEENLIVNNHSLNSNQDTSFNPNYSNQMLQKERESLQQPNFLNNQIYELQCRGQSSSSNESQFLRIMNSSSLADGGTNNSIPDVKNMNQDHTDRRSKIRDDDPADLEFDPCQESLNGLQELLISEASAMKFNAPNRSPLNNHRPPTLSSADYFDIANCRIPPCQPPKLRDPPPGFTNNCTQNILLHKQSPFGTGSLKTPIALHNQLGVRTNYNLQRCTQPAMPSNNSFLPDFSLPLSREIPDIIPPGLQQQHQQQQQQQQQHNQQRLINLSQLQQYPVAEQRSSPLWNNTSQAQWRQMENNLLFNQGITENRATNDFNMRMPMRSSDIAMRQWQQQQQQLSGSMNNSPFQEHPQMNHEHAKMQAMLKSLEAASRNSTSFGHRLQYTKKL